MTRKASMFGNTIKSKAGDADTTVNIVHVDGPSNRRTLRASAGNEYELSIAHQESNENPGFVTQRSNVRLTQRIALDDTDKTVKAYVQFQMSVPTDHFTAEQARKLTSRLVTFLALGENSGDTSYGEETDFASVTRLHAGEP